MRGLRTIIPALILAGVLAGPAMAGPYDDCIVLIATDAARAEVEAQRWIQAGGGAEAQHCRALALLGQGAERRAAELMVRIATDERTLPDEVRSEMLIDAGEIYLGIGDIALGRSVASHALLLSREPRTALALSARLKAAQGDWRGAVDDLDGALARGEPDAGLLVLRASARLHLNQWVAARSDLLWATEIAPDMASVWLERGVMEAAGDNRDAARAAWLKAIDLDREGYVGEAARLKLQKMDAGGN
jgi:tetratricopeptide (TPR) repeat protein